MILGALADLGVDMHAILTQLTMLDVGPFELQVKPAEQHDIHGTRVTVAIDQYQHSHRGLNDILPIIQKSELPDAVKDMSGRVFKRLAEAEAKIHGTTPDKIHFHEVGAVDSIVDIVGACLGLYMLHVDKVIVGVFPLGQGTIECAHGTLPCPAPATLELLKGFPVQQTEEPYELVTPTGAALLTTWSTDSPLPQNTSIMQIGYGFGQRKLEQRINAIRAAILQTVTLQTDSTTCVVLECNIDDTVPELLGTLTQQLMEIGALDTYTTPVQMKKQRPGTLLTVLCRPEKKEDMLDLIFRESTTFGIREQVTQRTELDRRIIEMETPYGTVRVKVGTWKNEDVTWSPEMADCITLARKREIPVRMVYEAALDTAQEWRKSVKNREPEREKN